MMEIGNGLWKMMKLKYGMLMEMMKNGNDGVAMKNDENCFGDGK